MQKWEIEPDGPTLRALAKLAEESGELVAILNRCVNQGVANANPDTEKPNRLALLEEMCDVEYCIKVLREVLAFDITENGIYNDRYARKMALWRRWESLYQDDTKTEAYEKSLDQFPDESRGKIHTANPIWRD